ncbi:ribonuclease HI [Neorhizobium sp. P12A]|uniref:ribonuclease H family protein n=1 Tax=Neorhizobium sp. P12A TaxID=2268027 RepID=UPI0011ED5BD9|nr:ribonuclease H [Neorhizobium sp. P12A]KAA0698548.1 ribonuclease HI [Neorhizobium sp. P12A]
MKTKLTPLPMDFKVGLHVFADGTCHPNPGAGGWAFVVYQNGNEIHHESGAASRTTNNRMELSAVLAALEWIGKNVTAETASLHSDSSYAVLGCNKWRKGWKKRAWRKGGAEIPNADLWKRLDEALAVTPIQLNWVRGHSGIRGNVRADRLAEKACRSPSKEAA